MPVKLGMQFVREGILYWSMYSGYCYAKSQFGVSLLDAAAGQESGNAVDKHSSSPGYLMPGISFFPIVHKLQFEWSWVTVPSRRLSTNNSTSCNII